jgi:glucokinase
MLLSIEIGGTKLQLGLGQNDGQLLAVERLAVQPEGGAAGIRQQIQNAVPDLLRKSNVGPTQLHGIGIGFGGPVDDRTRRTIKSHQVAGWEDFPLADWVEQQFNVPAALANDSDVAGLAEACLGAGQGYSPVFYMNIGSGIGGALIVNGQIFRGSGLGAAEIGHLWIDHPMPGNDPDPAGTGWHHLEALASGWAIDRAAQAHFGPDGPSDTKALAAAAEAGDATALSILSEARHRLALALSHVIALLAPRRIVIGGGVALIGEHLFFAPLRDELARIAFSPFMDGCDIVPAGLGEEVVVHGGLMLAQQHFQGG